VTAPTTDEQLFALVGQLRARNVELERIVARQADQIAELKRRAWTDSSNSSRPPSSDAPWAKVAARRRSSRTRSGRKPGKQPGAASTSRRLTDDPDDVKQIEPDRCQSCDACLDGAEVAHRQRRQVVDVHPPIDAGQVLPSFTGVLVRDGYAGYAHLPALHAWCAAHLLRDLRSISDADPDGQLWATAMATTLLEANHTAQRARERGAPRLSDDELRRIRNHFLGALARGDTDNQNYHSALADQARTLISRFRRFEDMILRFTTDLSVPFANNEAERACRPVKIQQRTSGGCWRTLQGLIDFAVVQSYLNTATKWQLDKLDVLRQLFSTGPWLPPALTPAE
jgi:hypothetical protein